MSQCKSLQAQERWLDREMIVEELAVFEVRDAEWTAQEVHLGLERLSSPHREALTLFFLEELAIGEIAQVIGVSEGTVKSRLYYAKSALRDALEKMRSRS